MSRGGKRKRKPKKPPSAAPPVAADCDGPSRAKKLLHGILLLATASLIGTTVWVSSQENRPSPLKQRAASSDIQPAALHTTFEVEPESLDELLALEPDELAKVDIARMNLLAAEGLPGAENLDVEASLAKLDQWTERVHAVTQTSLPDFHSRPEDFENSEAKFRTLLIISVLQQDFGVHYNDRGPRNVDFSDSRDPFIHGMVDENHGGNCASMPVLYTAIGRRLGYPMELVLGKTHIFGRWDGEASGGHPNPAYRERFNIEGTNEIFSHHPDSYYREWPHPISEQELQKGWYLKPLSAAERLAVFLEIRGCVLMDNGRYREAEFAFAHSRRLAPHNPLAEAYITQAKHAQRYGTLAARQTQRPVNGGLGLPVGAGRHFAPPGIDPRTGRSHLANQRRAEEQRIIAEQQRRMQQQWQQQPQMQPHQPHQQSGQPWPGQRHQPRQGMVPHHQPSQ